MRRHAGTIGFVIALALAGCATPPTPIMPADIDYDPEAYVTPPATPLVESPPVEPVEPIEPPPVSAAAPAAPAPGASPAAGNPVDPPAVAIGPPPTLEPTEDQQMIALLADLQRYGTLQNDELKKELTAAGQSLARQRTDVNRVRLAVLYTLVRNSPQDDQRAIQLFENVA